MVFDQAWWNVAAHTAVTVAGATIRVVPATIGVAPATIAIAPATIGAAGITIHVVLVLEAWLSQSVICGVSVARDVLDDII